MKVNISKLGPHVLATVTALSSPVLGQSSSGNLFCETNTITGTNYPNATTTETYTIYNSYVDTTTYVSTATYPVYTTTVTKTTSTTSVFTFWSTKASTTTTVPTLSGFTPFASASVSTSTSSPDNARLRRWDGGQRNGIVAAPPRERRSASQHSSSTPTTTLHKSTCSHKTTSSTHKTTATSHKASSTRKTSSSSKPQTLVATQVFCQTTITLPVTTYTDSEIARTQTTARTPITTTITQTITSTTHKVQTTDVNTVYAACYDPANIGTKWHGQTVDSVEHVFSYQLPPSGETNFGVPYPKLVQAAAQSVVECCNAAFRLQYTPASGVSPNEDFVFAFVYYGTSGDSVGECDVQLPGGEHYPDTIYFETGKTDYAIRVGSVRNPTYVYGTEFSS